MSTQDTAFETIEVLYSRIDLVESLLEQPMGKREIAEELSISRSTVDRATRELETADLIEYSDGCFELTSLGQMAATEFSEVIDAIQLRHELEPFFRWVPDEEFGFDLACLREAELLVPEPGNPYAMINRHVNLLEESDCSQLVLPMCGLHAYEAVHRKVVHEDGRSECIVVPAVADTWQTDPEYVDLTDELTPTGRFEVSVSDDELPYLIGVFDQTVQIGVNEEGEPRAILESESDEVRDWAEQQYTNYRTNAQQVIP